MTPAAFRKLALSMPGAHETPHFERTSFRVGTKIFATMTADGSEGMVPVHPISKCLALLAADPRVFIDHGGWTRKNGGLGIRLAAVDADLVHELMHVAWERVAPKRAATKSAGRSRRRPNSKA